MMNQTKKHTTSKKLLALLLALIMTVSLLPMSVFAAGLGTEPAQEEEAVIDVPATGENGEDAEPVDEDAAAADTYAATDEIAVQAATEIKYVEKIGEGKSLKDDTNFYRIVHIDCGRKYFSDDELKKIIDYAAASNYTHVELAFGNDGLRFLLDDMEVTASGVTYASENVKSAIKAGNTAFSSAGELIESEMNTLISYAKSMGIGIIPMFDAPGHLQAVIRAMGTLGISMTEGTDYCKATKSGTSYNWALLATSAQGNNFVQELVQKYITYFAGKGCTMFNIAADECGFTYDSDTNWSGMSNDQYTAYARFVNSMAARVQNAGMTALAFNDGIYHAQKQLTEDGLEFDTNIAICYWDATTSKYASAATLAGKGFKIINTHNKWYYVLGSEGSSWFGYQWAQGYMNGECKDCRKVDGGYTTDTGCMLALWCDNPNAKVSWTNVENHIKTLSTNNSTYFTAVKAPEKVDLPASNETTNVSVVVKGLEGQKATVTVTEKTEAHTEGLPTGAAAVSYEITPSVDNTAYTGAGTVTLPVPEEWKESTDCVCGYIVTDGKVETIAGTYDKTTGKYTFPVPHFSEMGLLLLAETSAELTEKTITVTVGGTVTDVIEGENHAGTYTTDDETTASVTVEGKDAQEATENYTKTSVSYSTLTGSNNSWTKTSYYYLASDDHYYPVYARYQRQGRNNYYYYYYGYSKSDSETDVTQIGNGTNGSTQVTVYTKTGKPATAASTTITFEGHKVGTTYVTIGNVKYTIEVTAEDLSKATPLPIQLWITNNTIEASGTNAKKTGSGWGGNSSLGQAGYISLPAATKDTASAVYSKNGMYLVDAFAAAGMTEPLVRYEWGGTRFITARDNKPLQNLVFWTGRIHNSTDSNIQTVWGGDYSNSGAAFTYVRYWNKVWQVSADRDTWTTVTGSGSTGTESNCKQQLAAYYMTRTEITKEVTTDVADWGKPNGGTEYTSQVSSDFVLLDYAVKYADGSRVPNKFPVTNKTLAYHCEKGNAAVGTDSSGNRYRMLNNFRGVETENFEVYMVTVTMTSASANTTVSTSATKDGYTYDDTTEQIVWAIDEDARAQSGLADYTSISGSSTYSGCKIGGAMDIRGVEIYNKHGALITYYVRAKAAVEDKLIVNYYVEGEKTPFYSYEIAVKANTTFDHRFARVTNPDLGLVNNTVENVINQTETVNWKLQEMPQIKAQYRYSEYDFVDANIDTNDYKTVNLYYTFKAEKTFVVDFGLPLVITPKDINQYLAANGVKITGADIGNVSSYAKITTDNDFNITYTLTKTIDGSDNFSLKYTGTLVKNETTGEVQVGEVKYSIRIIPASTVYYEDSFVTFTSGKKTDSDVNWEDVGEAKKDVTQALEQLGSKENVYGYDDAYIDCTTFSMGSAKKVTVDKDVTTNPTATFTFKGTGFDVISLTDNNSGAIVVDIYRGKEVGQNRIKGYFVNNYYGYAFKNGEWTASPSADNNALYQIPVIKQTGLDYDEYTVVITPAYGSAFDKTGDNQYSFWLDAIRVYDPMDKGYDYTGDQEGYPQYIKLRDELAKEAGTATTNEKLLFIDGEANAKIELYKNYGPNNEVYLASGQAISFRLTGDLESIDEVQIGAKSPDGTAGKAKISVNNQEIASATEMYYDITAFAKNGELVTIANNGVAGTILSLTNLKVTFSEKDKAISFASLSTENQDEAVAAVRALFAAPVEPDPEPVIFTPERFEASWSRSSVKVGQNATLTVKTSEDVEAITVDGVTIDTYRTRTQRTGWGWNAKKVTYREFTYTITASETADHEIVAVNVEGTASEAITATLTVQAAAQRPGWGGWFGNLFSRWF